MFDRRSDDMTAVRNRRFAHAADGEIVCFGAAGSKDDFVGPAVNERRDFAPRPIDSRTRLLAVAVNARGIAENFRQRSRHRLRNARVDGRRSAVIEINPSFRHESSTLRQQLCCGRSHLNGGPSGAYEATLRGDI